MGYDPYASVHNYGAYVHTVYAYLNVLSMSHMVVVSLDIECVTIRIKPMFPYLPPVRHLHITIEIVSC